jgi:hypothetical protein
MLLHALVAASGHQPLIALGVLLSQAFSGNEWYAVSRSGLPAEQGAGRRPITAMIQAQCESEWVCEVCFSAAQAGEGQSFYQWLTEEGWHQTTSSLNKHQLDSFHTAVGFIKICADGSKTPLFGEAPLSCSA